MIGRRCVRTGVRSQRTEPVRTPEQCGPRSSKPSPYAAPTSDDATSQAESCPSGVRLVAGNRNELVHQLNPRRALRETLVYVSVISPSDEPTGLIVLQPDEALKRARPAPKDEDLAIEDLTDAEWEAFTEALTGR